MKSKFYFYRWFIASWKDQCNHKTINVKIVIINIIIIIIQAALQCFELDRIFFGADMSKRHKCEIFYIRIYKAS
jgi:hypothetical protein